MFTYLDDGSRGFSPQSLWHCSEAERHDWERADEASYILPSDQEAEGEEGTKKHIHPSSHMTFFLQLGPVSYGAHHQ